MDDTVDLLSMCHVGLVLRTRARGYATITRIAAEDGLIHGEVRMFGPCVWRRNGIYRESPCGAAGPLDLIPPQDSATAERPRKEVKTADTFGSSNRFFCCD